MTEIPVLTTERLVLRGHRPEDFEAYAAFYASDRAAHIGGARSTRDAWRLFAADLGHWALKGFGWWMVTEEGRPVGTVGVHHPPFQDTPEIGWTLFEGAEGRGLACEAAVAAIRWAVRHLDLTRLVSNIDVANAPSIRLALRLGATGLPDRAAHDPECAVYLHDLERYRP